MTDNCLGMKELIRIPDTSFLIAAYEPEHTKGLRWLPSDVLKLKEGAFYRLNERGLAMPTPAVFMPYFVNVTKAFFGKGTLRYSNGKTLSEKEIEDLFKHLTISQFNKGLINKGAWSWLNARFVKGTGFQGLDLETVVDVNADGSLVTNKEPLLECVYEDCYVDLEFNPQGFPIKKAKIQKYKQGENTVFYYPRENSVVRFVVSLGGALLSCQGNPDKAAIAQGIFSIAKQDIK